MKAVHFGAGNIGRGFVGLLLHEGGYDLVFSDVSAALVSAINDASSYTVHEVGEGGVDKQVTNFRAIDSSVDAEALVDEIATADVVTTAVGPTILKFVAPHIVAGLALRDPSLPALQVMACENAIGATDQLRDHVVELAGEAWDALASVPSSPTPRSIASSRRRPRAASTSPSSRSTSGRSSGRRG